MPFIYPQKIQFKHCDPAGIVFYPRYFEMINDAVEAFFEEAVRMPFHKIIPKNGVPLADINVRFLSPSYHGESLDFKLEVLKIGRSSLFFAIEAAPSLPNQNQLDFDKKIKFQGNLRIVYINGHGKPTAWPIEATSKFIQYQRKENDDQ